VLRQITLVFLVLVFQHVHRYISVQMIEISRNVLLSYVTVNRFLFLINLADTLYSLMLT